MATLLKILQGFSCTYTLPHTHSQLLFEAAEFGLFISQLEGQALRQIVNVAP